MNKNKKILIVEDEIITAMDLMEIMRTWGYDFCSPVTSGQDAIGMAEAEKPDLMLMDVRLKGEMDGIEAARQIYARKQEIPVIFISGYAKEELQEKLKMKGRFYYIMKPLDFDELRSRIKAILD